MVYNIPCNTLSKSGFKVTQKSLDGKVKDRKAVQNYLPHVFLPLHFSKSFFFAFTQSHHRVICAFACLCVVRMMILIGTCPCLPAVGWCLSVRCLSPGWHGEASVRVCRRSVDVCRCGVCPQADMERRLSVFTGGRAEIRDVQPYEQTSSQTSGQQRSVTDSWVNTLVLHQELGFLCFLSAFLSHHHFGPYVNSWLTTHSPISSVV